MRGQQKVGMSTLPRRRKTESSTFVTLSETWLLTRRDPTRDSTPASEHRSSSLCPPTPRQPNARLNPSPCIILWVMPPVQAPQSVALKPRRI